MDKVTVLLLLIFLNNCVARAQTPLRERAYDIAIQYGIDGYLFQAIIETESGFKINAYNSKTQDYGLTQINIRNIKALHLDERRLLHDSEYSLTQGALILQKLQRQYSHENLWWSRYNCGTRAQPPSSQKACLKYAKKVNQKLQKLIIAKEEF